MDRLIGAVWCRGCSGICAQVGIQKEEKGGGRQKSFTAWGEKGKRGSEGTDHLRMCYLIVDVAAYDTACDYRVTACMYLRVTAVLLYALLYVL